MLVSEAITKINYALRGIDDSAPSSGTDEYNYWLSVLNQKKDELYQDISVTWRPTFKETAPNEPGTVATSGTTTLTGTSTNFTDYRAGDKILVDGETTRTIDAIASDTSLTVTSAFSNTASSKTFTHQSVIASGVQSYNLHRKFLAPSDQIAVTDSNGQLHYFDIIRPQERMTNKQQAFISDENPEILNFSAEIDSNTSYLGGTISAPAYYLPADMSAATDVLPFLDPWWAVYAVAAEVAFSDIVYETKAPDLNAKANALYQQMVVRNKRGTFNNPKKMPYNMPVLGDRTRR